MTYRLADWHIGQSLSVVLCMFLRIHIFNVRGLQIPSEILTDISDQSNISDNHIKSNEIYSINHANDRLIGQLFRMDMVELFRYVIYCLANKCNLNKLEIDVMMPYKMKSLDTKLTMIDIMRGHGYILSDFTRNEVISKIIASTELADCTKRCLVLKYIFDSANASTFAIISIHGVIHSTNVLSFTI